MTKSRRISGILETVVYCDTETEKDAKRFYEEVLGLRPVGLGGNAYRISEKQMLLLFNTDESSVQDDPPAHGAAGKIHSCFLVAPSDYEGWKNHLTTEGVEITRELTWKDGLRSFYFEDPAGNVLEIADGDLWPA